MASLLVRRLLSTTTAAGVRRLVSTAGRPGTHASSIQLHRTLPSPVVAGRAMFPSRFLASFPGPGEKAGSVKSDGGKQPTAIDPNNAKTATDGVLPPASATKDAPLPSSEATAVDDLLEPPAPSSAKDASNTRPSPLAPKDASAEATASDATLEAPGEAGATVKGDTLPDFTADELLQLVAAAARRAIEGPPEAGADADAVTVKALLQAVADVATSALLQGSKSPDLKVEALFKMLAAASTNLPPEATAGGGDVDAVLKQMAAAGRSRLSPEAGDAAKMVSAEELSIKLCTLMESAMATRHNELGIKVEELINAAFDMKDAKDAKRRLLFLLGYAFIVAISVLMFYLGFDRACETARASLKKFVLELARSEEAKQLYLDMIDMGIDKVKADLKVTLRPILYDFFFPEPSPEKPKPEKPEEPGVLRRVMLFVGLGGRGKEEEVQAKGEEVTLPAKQQEEEPQDQGWLSWLLRGKK